MPKVALDQDVLSITSKKSTDSLHIKKHKKIDKARDPHEFVCKLNWTNVLAMFFL